MRRVCGLLLLLVLLTVGPSVAAAPDEKKEPAKAKRPDALGARVTPAVDRAIRYLSSRQAPDGKWSGSPKAPRRGPTRMGPTALRTLACLKGGLTIRDPHITRALSFMRKQELTYTYDVAVLLMTLHALYAKSGTRPARPGGLRPTDMTESDRAWARRARDFLLEHERDGRWGYPKGTPDLSNTQFALLGLQAASLCGFKVPPKVWRRSLGWLMRSQVPRGPEVSLRVPIRRPAARGVQFLSARARGFRYRPRVRSPVTGSMTTAGIASIAICRDELWGTPELTEPLRKKIRRALHDAMAWIQSHFDVGGNPGQENNSWHFYYLYGLERAGVLTGVTHFGGHDWYRDGAEHLLATQRSDGSWPRGGGGCRTSFALLFLKRATPRARNPVVTVTAK